MSRLRQSNYQAYFVDFSTWRWMEPDKYIPTNFAGPQLGPQVQEEKTKYFSVTAKAVCPAQGKCSQAVLQASCCMVFQDLEDCSTKANGDRASLRNIRKAAELAARHLDEF